MTKLISSLFLLRFISLLQKFSKSTIFKTPFFCSSRYSNRISLLNCCCSFNLFFNSVDFRSKLKIDSKFFAKSEGDLINLVGGDVICFFRNFLNWLIKNFNFKSILFFLFEAQIQNSNEFNFKNKIILLFI